MIIKNLIWPRGDRSMETNIAGVIDHTLLKPDATEQDIDQLIQEALHYEFASVCVHPYWVSHCYEQLKTSTIRVCTVIGFPLGVNCTETKVFEANEAIENGATEIDMVINIGALKDEDNALVEQDIAEIVKTAKDKAIVKVIIETSLLTEEEKMRACQLAKQAQADFVKTSTGFSDGGATAKDVTFMRQVVGTSLGVKASGGIRTLADLQSMLDAGASRIGASSGVAIMEALNDV